MGGAGNPVRLLGVHPDGADLYLDDTWTITMKQKVGDQANGGEVAHFGGNQD